MNLERSIGFIFLISTILALGFLIEPQEQYKNNQTTTIINQVIEPEDNSIQVTQTEEVEVVIEEVSEIEIKEKSESILVDSTTDAEFLKESDFDLFVLRVHVLSSEDNAKKMVTKINEGGFPAFTEVFGSKKNLHAVYVGPFIEESDINQNIELIQKVSESQNGEISRWKL